jgi:spermidine synthase
MSANPELIASLHGSRYLESACSADTISMYSIDRCLWAGNTSFSEVVIAKSPVFGGVLFIDKELQSAASDEAIYHEHLVHPVMAATAHIPNRNVLIVGGGEGATAREVLKWNNVATIHWVDIDGLLVDLCRRHLGWADDYVYNDPRVHFHAEDIRAFFRTNASKFDVIILDLPDPDVDELESSEAENETDDDYILYGNRFWQILRTRLQPGGALVSHVGPLSPGGDETVRRAGLAWVRDAARRAGIGSGENGFPYHVCIPSFQGEWGFWMWGRTFANPWSLAGLPGGLRVATRDQMIEWSRLQQVWLSAM